VRAPDSRDVVFRPLRPEQNPAPSQRPQVHLDALCVVVLVKSAVALIGWDVKESFKGLSTRRRTRSYLRETNRERRSFVVPQPESALNKGILGQYVDEALSTSTAL
jgi:hypothetical protein